MGDGDLEHFSIERIEECRVPHQVLTCSLQQRDNVVVLVVSWMSGNEAVKIKLARSEHGHDDGVLCSHLPIMIASQLGVPPMTLRLVTSEGQLLGEDFYVDLDRAVWTRDSKHCKKLRERVASAQERRQ